MGLFNLFSKDMPKKEKSVKEEQEDFSNFKSITNFIYERSGITELDQRALTASRLQNYAKEKRIFTTISFLEHMNRSEEFYQEVMNIATINESFFFREKKELDWLVSFIKKSEKNLDILVLPCSTGEEVYSILLLLLEEEISLDKVNISGCDLNSQAIKSAINGEYDEHSLNKLTPPFYTKYFIKNEKNLYNIKSELCTKPSFFQENIFEINTSKKQYDVVLSRNMFIYFDDEKRNRALNIIIDLLKSSGIYIKGHADHIEKNNKLVNITYGIYSKQI